MPSFETKRGIGQTSTCTHSEPWMSIAESNRSVRRGENKKPRHIGESASKGGASGVQKKEKRQRGRREDGRKCMGEEKRVMRGNKT